MALTYTATEKKTNLHGLDFAVFLAVQELVNEACHEQTSDTTVVRFPLNLPVSFRPFSHTVSEEILSKLVETHAADGDTTRFIQDEHGWVFTIDPPKPKPMKYI